jgi:hypothetical protein
LRAVGFFAVGMAFSDPNVNLTTRKASRTRSTLASPLYRLLELQCYVTPS